MFHTREAEILVATGDVVEVGQIIAFAGGEFVTTHIAGVIDITTNAKNVFVDVATPNPKDPREQAFYLVFCAYR